MIKKILNIPIIYHLSQKVFLADNFRKKILQKLITKKNCDVLDIGCGPGNMINYLSYKKYYGFDTDKNYIKYAKNKYVDCIFFCEKFTKSSLKKITKVDVIILFGILHHVSDRETLNLINKLKLSLKKNSKIIILDPVYIKKQNKFAKFLIDHDRGGYVRTAKEYINLFKKNKISYTHKIYHQKIVPYTYIVSILKN